MSKNKDGGSKHVWSDSRKKSQSAARVRRDKRKAERIKDQEARASINRALKKAGELSLWEKAKLARAARREGLKPKERTALGNIIEVGEDGIKRVRPGSKREIETALHFRQEEAKREAAARYEDKKRKQAKAAKKEKVA